MNSIRASRAAVLSASVLALAACSDATMAPVAVSNAVKQGAALVHSSLVGYPDVNDPASWEGALIICKQANAAGTFDIDYSVTAKTAGTLFTSGTVSVAAGTCVKAAQVPGTITPGGYLVDIQEHALPANWAMTNYTALLSQPTLVRPAAVVDLNARTATGQFLGHDVGVVITIENTYTAPTGQIGDFVWNDLNHNGVQDAGEPGIPNVKVNLSGSATASTTTDANGAYLFTGLDVGSYTVTVDASTLPAGYLPTLTGQGTAATDNNGSPANTSLATPSSQDLTLDFGYYLPPPPPPPGPSCTLTQGFWKTHQELWDTKGEKVVWNGQLFFNSGRTYAQIYAMNPSGGNSYIQLAHQYIAAVLNVNGGSDPAADAAIANAAAKFSATAAGVTFVKNAAWTALATTLDNYNTGVTGPGHCN